MSLRDQATNQLPRVHAPPSTVQDTTYERAQREPASQPGWLRRLLENYRSHDGEGLATAVAFNTLVALVPLMMLVFLAVSLLVQLASVRGVVDDVLNAFLSTSDTEATLDFIRAGRESAGGIGLIAIAGLGYGGYRLFNGLNQALSAIYDAPGRSSTRQKLAGMIMAPAVTLLLLLSAVAACATTIVFVFPSYFTMNAESSWPAGVAGYLIALVIAVMVGSVVFSAFPQGEPVETIVPGALFFALSFTLLSQVFPLYAWLASGFSPYATVPALVLLVLVWLYLSGQCIVLGAELNAMLSGRHDANRLTTSQRAAVNAPPRP